MRSESATKTIYFDIDGTVLLDEHQKVKSALGQGCFERAVREAGFTDLVCVGNFAGIAHTLKSIQIDYDGLGMIFQLCAGAFEDEKWFRARTALLEDPADRAKYIDLNGDWWYVDDLAEYYMERAGLEGVFTSQLGSRICMPDPDGDGQDVLEWLSKEHDAT